MNSSVPEPFFSIVIPAYNEEKRLPDTLQEIATFLRRQHYQAEILVVENGSDDDTSGVVDHFRESAVAPDDNFQVRLLHSRPGKGAAVKVGMLAARGEYRFICDADLSMPIAEVDKFLPPRLDSHRYGIAIASREIRGAVRYGEPVYRHLMGRIFNRVVRLLAVPGIEDTQCGFKCFTREAAQLIFPLQTIDGWAFDIELLYIGRLHHFRLVEVPINWYYKESSRIHPIRDSIRMVLEVLRIRRNARAGLYQRSNAPAFSDELMA